MFSQLVYVAAMYEKKQSTCSSGIQHVLSISERAYIWKFSKELKLSGSTIIQDWLTDACHKIYSAPGFFILPARLWALRES